MKLEIVIRKNAQGKKLTAAERKLLADYRRKNPAWSKIYESAVATFPKVGLTGAMEGRISTKAVQK